MHATVLMVNRVEEPAVAREEERVRVRSCVMEFLKGNLLGNLQHAYSQPAANGLDIILFFNSATPGEALLQTRHIADVLRGEVLGFAEGWRVECKAP
ncbi:hypothetical protein AB0N17_14945 [Streptomyces sp. NPDC051133]|uniref:hypothetical protein n=1 Tax=Streptomyces sp. NPDC051133 TaxID=3155521 RepID=UPI00342DA9E8